MWWPKVAFILHLILLQMCTARKHHLEIQVRLLVNYVIKEEHCGIENNRQTSILRLTSMPMRL